jgi:hypothetical protein
MEERRAKDNGKQTTVQCCTQSFTYSMQKSSPTVLEFSLEHIKENIRITLYVQLQCKIS